MIIKNPGTTLCIPFKKGLVFLEFIITGWFKDLVKWRRKLEFEKKKESLLSQIYKDEAFPVFQLIQSKRAGAGIVQDKNGGN